MPSMTELRTIQKSTLFDLLKLKKELQLDAKPLNDLILKSIVVMDEEDVAWVEKQIANLD